MLSLYTADALSRSPCEESDGCSKVLEEEVEDYVSAITVSDAHSSRVSDAHSSSHVPMAGDWLGSVCIERDLIVVDYYS